MILINLLPHRQEKRQRRRIAFFIGLGVAGVAGLLIVAAWYFVLQHLISNQQQRNQFLQAEITRLEAQIKDIATLKAEIEALKARQKAVEDLQTGRNVPVRLMTELVKQVPEGVYLSAIKQTGNVVAVNGIAQTNERVSELLRNTAYSSEWLNKPELIEIRAAGQGQGRDARRVFDFSMRLNLKPPADAASAAPASASGVPVAAAAASAPKKP